MRSENTSPIANCQPVMKLIYSRPNDRHAIRQNAARGSSGRRSVRESIDGQSTGPTTAAATAQSLVFATADRPNMSVDHELVNKS